MAKQKDFLYMICRGMGFDQMLMESLNNSYVVITHVVIHICSNIKTLQHFFMLGKEQCLQKYSLVFN